jgi:hypothetical protein
VTFPPLPAVPCSERAKEDRIGLREFPMIFPPLALREIFSPFPAFPEFEYDNDIKKLLVVILPESEVREIAPPFPAFPEFEFDNDDN